MPRHATPRLRVAGRFGRHRRTPDRDLSARVAGRMADHRPHAGCRSSIAHRSPAALLAPGDTVRFVPDRIRSDVEPAFKRPRRRSRLDSRPRRTRSLDHRPAPWTLHHDSGQRTMGTSGERCAGQRSAWTWCRIASRTRSSATIARAATLEATLAGPEMRIETGALVAVTGADLGARIDGQELPLNRRCDAGRERASLRRTPLGRARVHRLRRRDRRAAGAGQPCHAHAVQRLGGLDGRAVAAGDRLAARRGSERPARGASSAFHRRASTGGARLRVLPGPQHDHFSADALDVLERTRFTSRRSRIEWDTV